MDALFLVSNCSHKLSLKTRSCRGTATQDEVRCCLISSQDPPRFGSFLRRHPHPNIPDFMKVGREKSVSGFSRAHVYSNSIASPREVASWTREMRCGEGGADGVATLKGKSYLVWSLLIFRFLWVKRKTGSVMTHEVSGCPLTTCISPQVECCWIILWAKLLF